jgi:hypothetical protein
MRKITILVFRSAKAKAAVVGTTVVRKQIYRKTRERKKAEFGR